MDTHPDTRTATAVVQTGTRRMETRQIPIPPIGPEEALIQVEACGLCGTDVARYRGEMSLRGAVVPGHEPVGVVVEIGDEAAARRGLRRGDRVAVDPFLPCWRCRSCVGGSYEFCTGWGDAAHSLGAIPVATAPGLWGGYATHLYVHPNAVLYPLPADLDPATATLYNPLGAGIRWGVDLTGVTVGSTLLVLGCGQRGLACLIAAKAAGAAHVIVTGLPADRHKLELAGRFGASATVVTGRDDLASVVRELTGGSGVDAVVDTTPGSTEAVTQAIGLVRPEGTVVLGGHKGRVVPDFPVDDVVLSAITIKGVRGVGTSAYQRAIAMLTERSKDLEVLRSHTFALDEAEHALRVLGGEVDGERPVNVVLRT
ncbi:zinc-dependent alcohol dehydrogenase [Yinghuangia sp. YIM S09857]|uniref:zinc-dependent alcohol dehydrogenase n=1 Tax=Yinghuangia sp. YIM S09857 TaxID=3436929 RepID=UPI003F53A3B1